MKLTIDELRPLVATREDITKNMTTLQRIEGLDLSNGGIVGDQITALLAYIALSSTPVALRSVDLGHNRLGDAGAIALAEIIQANAAKLPHMVALDLFENSIRDEGALALINVIQDQVEAGNLLRLTSVSLHDNDISEVTLRAIDNVWLAVAKIRIPSLPTESESLSFGDLLKREVKAIKVARAEEIARAEAARKRAEAARVEEIARAEAARVEEIARAEAARVEEIARAEAARAEMINKKLQPLTTFLKITLWRLVAHDREVRDKVVLRFFKNPTKMLVETWEMREDVLGTKAADTAKLDALLAQMIELFACLSDTSDAITASSDGMREDQLRVMGAALTKNLGLPVRITRYDWYVEEELFDEYDSEDGEIDSGYELTCEIPS